jgi:hypothetical protein
MSDDKRSRDRFDDDDVANVFDRDGKIVLDVDKVIIRADEVIIIKKDDKRRHNRFDNARRDDDRRDDDQRNFWI